MLIIKITTTSSSSYFEIPSKILLPKSTLILEFFKKRLNLCNEKHAHTKYKPPRQENIISKCKDRNSANYKSRMLSRRTASLIRIVKVLIEFLKKDHSIHCPDFIHLFQLTLSDQSFKLTRQDRC